MNIREKIGEIPIIVSLDDIDKTIGPYSMSFAFNLKPLITSIERFGLINTPFVTLNKQGRMDVVVGYRRILALKSLQWDRVPCIDLSDSGLSPFEFLVFNLHDNLATRKFNDVEKGMILNRLISHLPVKDILEHYMPLLNLPSNESTFNFFLRLEELEAQIKESLAKGVLSLRATKFILKEIDRESRSSVFNWISNIKFNFNQQLKFVEYTVDISIRENKPIPELLSTEQLMVISEDKKINNPQKAKLILDLLRSWRFPFLFRSEKSFRKKISSLDLPEGVRIQHPPFFEGPDYRLEVLFKDGKELEGKINSLSRLSGLEKIRDPWEKDS